jgi:voltage-gated sodium channel type XI alpha
VLQKLGFLFTGIYVAEALIKVIANGFLFGQNTYLRNPFNMFDFAIVISALVEMLMNLRSENQNVEAIMTFRTLRALRVLKLFTGFYKNRSMREQIRTLMRAMKGLLNVLVFLSMFFLLLAIIGLQLFSDDIYNACRLTPEPVEVDGKLVWERAPTEGLSPGGICSMDFSFYAFGGYHCPEQYTCGTFIDYRMPLEEDGVGNNAQLYYDIASWKNFGSSFVAVFQILSADTWSNHLYNMINSTDFLLPVFFVFCIHMLGTYFIMHLTMVVIMDSYVEAEEAYAQDEINLQKSMIIELEKTFFSERYFSAQ